MSVADRIRTNIADVFTFGPSVVLRHLGRLREDRMATVPLPEVGRVHVRAGESDIAGVRQVFQEREYALEWPPELGRRVREHYRAILARGRKPIIADIGANIGAASLWFGKEYPEATIVAVEPDPGNLAVLRRNVGHRPNHVVLEAAIGAEPGFVQLTNPDMSWAVQTTRADSGVPVVTVDECFSRSGGDEPFIVKIDIEGFESDLFASNLGWLERAYIVFIEPHDWMLPGKQSSRNFQRAMAEHPFELFIHGENLLYTRI
jgi:FkbM family methyltransferase